MRAVKPGRRCRTVPAPSPGPMLVLPPPGHCWNSASSLPPTSSSFKANNCTTDNVSVVMSPFQSYFRQNLIRRCGFPRCISPPPPPHPYSSCLRTKYFSPVVVLNLRTRWRRGREKCIHPPGGLGGGQRFQEAAQNPAQNLPQRGCGGGPGSGLQGGSGTGLGVEAAGRSYWSRGSAVVQMPEGTAGQASGISRVQLSLVDFGPWPEPRWPPRRCARVFLSF